MKQSTRTAIVHLNQVSNRLGYHASCTASGIYAWEEMSPKLAAALNEMEDAIAAVRRNWPKPGDIDGQA